MQRGYRHPMRYWAAVVVVGLVVGSVGHAQGNSLITDVGTLAWIVGLVMLVRAVWQRRHNQQRD